MQLVYELLNLLFEGTSIIPTPVKQISTLTYILIAVVDVNAADQSVHQICGKRPDFGRLTKNF